MFTIEPPPCARITGSTACEQKNVPYRSISITLFHALGDERLGRRVEVPGGVVHEQIDATVRALNLGDGGLHALRLAHVHGDARSPCRRAARISAAAVSTRSSLRLASTTCAPSDCEQIGDPAADAAAAAGDRAPPGRRRVRRETRRWLAHGLAPGWRTSCSARASSRRFGRRRVGRERARAASCTGENERR